MKIFLIGSGGREHVIAWKFRQDDPHTELFIAPGNAGTATLGTNVAIAATDIEALLAWAQVNNPNLTFVGPEAPLCGGIVDAFQSQGLPIFGPNRAAAQLEGSKVFTKKLLEKYGIPTARSRAFRVAAEAYAYSQSQPYPQVIKADGLASGKGVTVALTPWAASHAIYDAMQRKLFGEAGAQLLIEEFLAGRELSLHVVCDGTSFQLFPGAQDYKRLGDGDTGPNTGGMGAYAPAPLLTAELGSQIVTTIVEPTLAGLRSEGIDFRGILYVGLMITKEGPKVLEFNVRFGDPETQVLLPLLETPLAELANAVIEGRLSSLTLNFKPLSAVGIVMAAADYPKEPRQGDVISGIGGVEEAGGLLFLAGAVAREGETVTNGGRVLTVVGLAPELAKSRECAYDLVKRIQFTGMQWRSDIADRVDLMSKV